MKAPLHAESLIQQLQLEPLPGEGGFYRQTHKSKLAVDGGQGPRAACTAIYYLVTPASFSALHKVLSDEIFHFYAGGSCDMVQISPEGNLTRHRLGNDWSAGDQPQIVVPAHYWQGLKLSPGAEWALMGCTVAPGFEFVDFELGSRPELLRQFPAHQSTIVSYTR